ncbi:MAG: serine protease, partial [Actinomycetota bacterium]
MDDIIQAAVGEEIPEDLTRLATQQARSQDELLGLDNVVGVGIGRKVEGGEETDTNSLVVLVTQKLPPDALGDQAVKRSINRVPTDVIEVGHIFAGGQMMAPETDRCSTEESVDIETLRKRVRPVRPGYSVGHPRVTAGTIGAGAYDLNNTVPGKPSKYYILSNNHVIANSNDAAPGDPIIQPGRVDGGQVPRDVIGRLDRFVPIKFIEPGEEPPCNYVDAAVAEVPFDTIDRDIYWNGYPASLFASAEPGMLVKKTGRTTDFTTGRVQAINTTVNVNYGAGRVARFCRQIITTDMSAGGDSGSLVLDFE